MTDSTPCKRTRLSNNWDPVLEILSPAPAGSGESGQCQKGRWALERVMAKVLTKQKARLSHHCWVLMLYCTKRKTPSTGIVGMRQRSMFNHQADFTCCTKMSHQVIQTQASCSSASKTETKWAVAKATKSKRRNHRAANACVSFTKWQMSQDVSARNNAPAQQTWALNLCIA